jgi:hypothetical protein
MRLRLLLLLALDLGFPVFRQQLFLLLGHRTVFFLLPGHPQPSPSSHL